MMKGLSEPFQCLSSSQVNQPRNYWLSSALLLFLAHLCSVSVLLHLAPVVLWHTDKQLLI